MTNIQFDHAKQLFLLQKNLLRHFSLAFVYLKKFLKHKEDALASITYMSHGLFQFHHVYNNMQRDIQTNILAAELQKNVSRENLLFVYS